jgi:hypothetical protein
MLGSNSLDLLTGIYYVLLFEFGIFNWRYTMTSFAYHDMVCFKEKSYSPHPYIKLNIHI